MWPSALVLLNLRPPARVTIVGAGGRGGTHSAQPHMCKMPTHVFVRLFSPCLFLFDRSLMRPVLLQRLAGRSTAAGFALLLARDWCICLRQETAIWKDVRRELSS